MHLTSAVQRWVCEFCACGGGASVGEGSVSAAPDEKARGVRAGGPSLLCEFQGWTGLTKVCVSDMNPKWTGVKKTARGYSCC